MVVIRLSRTGAKKNPYYHVVAADKRKPRDGRFIEKLGRFNPVARGQETLLTLNQERLDYWVKQGAKLSERVQGLLKHYQKTGSQPIQSNVTAAELKKAQIEASKKAVSAKLAAERAEAEAAAKAEADAKAAEEAEKAKAEAEAAKAEAPAEKEAAGEKEAAAKESEGEAPSETTESSEKESSDKSE